MNYSKRIVVDFDETLAWVTNYDFENARVNTALIAKLNTFVDEGWTVDVFTARGHLSCESREAAALKYCDKIISLLDKHGLKYNLLSFDKPFAALYIDDKAITPTDFLNENIDHTGSWQGVKTTPT